MFILHSDSTSRELMREKMFFFSVLQRQKIWEDFFRRHGKYPAASDVEYQPNEFVNGSTSSIGISAVGRSFSNENKIEVTPVHNTKNLRHIKHVIENVVQSNLSGFMIGRQLCRILSLDIYDKFHANAKHELHKLRKYISVEQISLYAKYVMNSIMCRKADPEAYKRIEESRLPYFIKKLQKWKHSRNSKSWEAYQAAVIYELLRVMDVVAPEQILKYACEHHLVNGKISPIKKCCRKTSTS